jgi:hypothetical protein
MEITVWSVAADDDNGTYASVHETELTAYRRLIALTVNSDDQDQIAKAEAFVEVKDFDGLDDWIHAEVIEPLNTYSVDQHKLDVPAASDLGPADKNKYITRRELGSVLHSLRLMQEQWEPQMHGCTSISLHDPLELSEPSSCDHFCDGEDSALSPAEIDDLCVRLNMGFCNEPAPKTGRESEGIPSIRMNQLLARGRRG